MSNLRPTLCDADPATPCMRNGTAYLMILSSVQQARGLVHGHLHSGGASCAIGRYFDVNKRTSLPNDLIDEVAAVNDSVPHLTQRGRKLHVERWLRWKLTQLGMPGFETRKVKRPAKPPQRAGRARRK